MTAPSSRDIPETNNEDIHAGASRPPLEALVDSVQSDPGLGDPLAAETPARPVLRGFAAMGAERQREIASRGGKASGGNFANDTVRAAAAGRKGGESVPREKRSFSKNPELAAEAGRKGGRSVPPEKRSFSQDPGLAANAGRKGGQSSGGNFANDRHRAAEAGRRGGQSGGDGPSGAE